MNLEAGAVPLFSESEEETFNMLLKGHSAVQAPEPTPQVNPSEEQKAALRACAEQLQPLWEILSQCISKIEAGLGEQSTQQEQAHLLPPEAAQVRLAKRN